MESFEARVSLACSPEAAFDFLIQPANIRAISPPSMGLFFVEAPERLSLGARMQFRVQAFGMAREATHEVTSFTPSASFIEAQITGPMRHWEHEHLLQVSPSGVVVIDRIRFEPPGGVIGLLINKNKILEHLEDGFDFRHGQLEKLLGAA